MIRRTGRTPLFSALQNCMREARQENAETRLTDRISRRDFLQGVAAGSAALAGSQFLQACSPAIARSFSQKPRIAIVGGGLAGLTAAHYLKKAGLHADIYEASSRVGGRCYSTSGLLGPGLTTELGGEFFDTSNEDALGLSAEFALELIDYRKPPESNLREAFYFQGALHSQSNLVSEFRMIAPLLERDIAALEINPGAPAAFDAMSLSAYLDSIGASGWVRSLIEVAYVTEYGLDADQQSCLNFLSLVSPDTTSGRLEIFGASDERFKIRGGNDLLARRLAAGLQDQIHLDQRLERLSRLGDSYLLDFQSSASSRTVEADFVIMTLPFSLLRLVKLDLELPSEKRRAIAELGYGTNSKLFLGFSGRVWRNDRLSGNFFSDLSSQSGWDNTRLQHGDRGGITIYSGGAPGANAHRTEIPAAARAAVRDLQHFMPGTASAFSGEAHRFDWPTNRWSLGSYAAYKTGQWTSIAGHEGTPVGRLLFAGEHCSKEFQGYLNGAVQTGRLASESLLAQLSPKLETVLFSRASSLTS